MYYLSSRHYDPNTGRFLQRDTFKGDVYSPWTQNLYIYTTNNPVNYIDPTGHWPQTINTPFYKPGQSYNDVLKLYNQEKAAGRIPKQPENTYIYHGPVNNNTTNGETNGPGGGPPSTTTKRSTPKKGTPKSSSGVVKVPIYIMGAYEVSIDDGKARIVGAFDRLSRASGTTTFEVEFVSDINDSLFVYNLRAGMEVAGSETSNYYEVPDYIDLVLESASGTSKDLLKAQQADEYAVIEESMHMAGMKEEHYNGHTPSQQKNCPYKGTFLNFRNKKQGSGPNKAMADVIEYYLTTGKYNYTYCTYEH